MSTSERARARRLADARQQLLDAKAAKLSSLDRTRLETTEKLGSLIADHDRWLVEWDGRPREWRP